MKEFKPCGGCVHFFVCNNVYAEVDKDTVIKNIDGEPCYYYDSEVVARTTYDRLREYMYLCIEHTIRENIETGE